MRRHLSDEENTDSDEESTDSLVTSTDDDEEDDDDEGVSKVRTEFDINTLTKDTLTNLVSHARQQFITNLSKLSVREPIRRTYGTAVTHDITRRAELIVRFLYKRWKEQTLERAKEFANEWVRRPENAAFQQTTDYQSMRTALSRTFNPNCLLEVFPWAHVIAFGYCSREAKQWLRCR